MSDYSLVRSSLEEALKLARTSQPTEAVARLERGLKTARASQDAEAVASLARHAGLLSYSAGNDKEAIAYYEEALANGPQDAYLYLALSEAYVSLGQAEPARASLARALDLATQVNDAELLAILKVKLEVR